MILSNLLREFFIIFSIFVALVNSGEHGESSAAGKHEEYVRIKVKHALIDAAEKDIQQKQMELFKKLNELQTLKREKAEMEHAYGTKIEENIDAKQIEEKEKAVEDRIELIGVLNSLNLQQLREMKNAKKIKETEQIRIEQIASDEEDQRGMPEVETPQSRRRIVPRTRKSPSGSPAPQHPTALGIQMREPQTANTPQSVASNDSSQQYSQSSLSPHMERTLRESTLRQEHPAHVQPQHVQQQHVQQQPMPAYTPASALGQVQLQPAMPAPAQTDFVPPMSTILAPSGSPAPQHPTALGIQMREPQTANTPQSVASNDSSQQYSQSSLSPHMQRTLRESSLGQEYPSPIQQQHVQQQHAPVSALGQVQHQTANMPASAQTANTPQSVASNDSSQQYSSLSPHMQRTLRESTLWQENLAHIQEQHVPASALDQVQHQLARPAPAQTNFVPPMLTILVDDDAPEHAQTQIQQTQNGPNKFIVNVVVSDGHPMVNCNVKLYKPMSKNWSATEPGRFELFGKTNEHGIATFFTETIKADYGELLALEIGRVKGMRKMFVYANEMGVTVEYVDEYLVTEMVPQNADVVYPLQVNIVWEDSERNDFLKNKERTGFYVRVNEPDIADRSKILKHSLHHRGYTVANGGNTEKVIIGLPYVRDGMELAIKVNINYEKNMYKDGIIKFFHYKKGMQQITFPYDHTEIKEKFVKRKNSGASGSKSSSKKSKSSSNNQSSGRIQ